MDIETYKKTFKEDGAPGWDAIDAALESVYGKGEPLGHFASELPTSIGGKGPDGISVYSAEGHLHYVSYGFSNLYYDEKSVGARLSGYGFELTFRLRSEPVAAAGIPRWPLQVIRNLFAYVEKSGRTFSPNDVIPIADRPINADLTLSESVITGLFFLEDPVLKSIQTPHGKVRFVQIFGMTRTEAVELKKDPAKRLPLIESLRPANPLWITDMKRGL